MSAALTAFFVGLLVSAFAMHWIVQRNRRTESPLNERAEAPSQSAMNWHIVHIRDDIGSLCVLIAIGNGLLAAILVALINRG